QSPVGQAAWLSANVNRVEELFAHEATSVGNCNNLTALRRSNSSKKWGWPTPDQL
ncbi:MAG: hypothetical protein QOC58_2154, partial [Mycobacterium sp.]|nr:hypothetical protein [Mycobacterium sp.]